jgi:hypothetical protein
MKHVLRSGPVMIEETDRATTFEIFFDLVFVFALTRITAFMAQAPAPVPLFLRFTVRSTSPAQLVAIGATLLLLPASRFLPALIALGLLTALLAALACYERLSRLDHNPAVSRAKAA